MATTITKLFPTGVLQSSVEFDEITLGSNEQIFTHTFGSGAPATYSWTAPVGVTRINVVCVGGGGGGASYNGSWTGSGGGGGALAYANNITVVPGTTYTVTVGNGGYGCDGSDPGNIIKGDDGGNSSFSTLVIAGGGKGGTQTQGGAGGTVIAGTGGAGGAGGSKVSVPPGGGGAGGYSGPGGNGSNTNGVAGGNGSGGGAGGGGASNGSYTFGQAGAGVGIYGEGTSGTGGIGGVDQPGAVLPTGGSGGLPYFGYNGNPGSGNPVYGGTYGGGGGGATATGGFGGNGAVRISWNNTTTRVSPTGVYAKEFDEVTLPKQGYLATISSTYIDNNNASDAVTDSSGNTYYVGAVTVASNGSYGLLLTKYNSLGVIQWQRQLIGPNQQTLGNAIIISPAGDIYVAGYAVGGDGGVVLVKYNTSGTVQWQRSFNGFPNAYGNGITVDSLNNLYLVIQYYIGGQAVGVINKYDSSGTLLWKQQLSNTGGEDLFLQDIISDPAGNIYVAGTAKVSGVYSSVQLAKYNTSGVLQWQQKLLTNSTISAGFGIALDSAGNIYISGSTDENNNTFRSAILIAKFNSSGTVQWTKRLTSGPSSASTLIAAGNDIVIDSLDNIYICGTEQADFTALRYAVIAKYNTSGTLQWQRTISGGADIKARGINIDSQGMIYVTGSIAPGSSQSNGGSWILAKLPGDGSLTGSYTINGVSVNYAASALNSHAGSLSSSASTLIDSTNTGTSTVSTLTESVPTYTASLPTVVGGPAERRTSTGTYMVSGEFDEYTIAPPPPVTYYPTGQVFGNNPLFGQYARITQLGGKYTDPNTFNEAIWNNLITVGSTVTVKWNNQVSEINMGTVTQVEKGAFYNSNHYVYVTNPSNFAMPVINGSPLVDFQTTYFRIEFT
jgi:hypothetical protein